MKFSIFNLRHFENTKKEIKNGEVLLLNNIGKGIQKKHYNVITQLEDNNWDFYILLDKKNDDTVSLCQLIPYQNNDSWPFSPIMIHTLNKNGNLIEQQYQPNLDAITNYHTVFSLSYYYFENQTSEKRKQNTIKTFYALAATEPRIDAEILQVLNDSNNKFPLPESKKQEIKKRINKKGYLKRRWEKKETTTLNPPITNPFFAEEHYQPLTWSAEEFITLKNKINNEDENNKEKIINQHIISCVKPFKNQLILIKKNIKKKQTKRNFKIINVLTTKLTYLEHKITNKPIYSSSTKTIKKIQNQINELTSIAIKVRNDNQIDNKNIKFSKQLLTIINEEHLLKKKKNVKTKYQSHYKL